MDSLCFCPPDTLEPPCAIGDSYCSSFSSMKSVACAILAARFTSSIVAPSFPYFKLDSIVPENNTPFCGTYPIFSHRSCCFTSRISTPSTKILPRLTSKNLGIRLTNVDLPLPVLPINAVVLPAGAVKLIL